MGVGCGCGLLLLSLLPLLLLPPVQARARAAGPQALAKFEERLQRQMQKRDMRKRTVKM